MIDLAVLSPGNLAASVVSGLLFGAYLTWFHPDTPDLTRRSILSGWYIGSALTGLYAARVAVSLWRSATEPDFETDLPRLIPAWLLVVLFSVFVGVGVGVVGRWKIVREKRKLRRAAQGGRR